MRRLMALVPLLLLVAAPAAADCIANGHYTIVGNPQPLRGTRFPYSEDLAHRQEDLPVGARFEVGYHDDLRWVKIQSGCAAFDEKNVSASVPVNVMLTAALRINYTPYPTAPSEARYEVQLRLGRTSDDPAPIAQATELRHIGPRVPRMERFTGGIVRDLPPGNYVYSMWFRLLDGPESNSLHVDLQWLTAQGVPADYAAAQIAAEDIEVGQAWTRAGDALELDSRWPIDVALQSSFRVDAVEGATKLSIAWTADGEPIGEFGTIAVPAYLPEGTVAFDDKRALSAERHRIQMWMRSDAGVAHVGDLRAGAFAMPLRLPYLNVVPMVHVSATEPVVVTPIGDAVQPPSMSPICGAWTKVMEFELPPSEGAFQFTMEGYVEITGFDVTGYGQIGVDMQHRRNGAAPGSNDFDESADIGMFEFQAQPGGDGIYFHGDCSKWGNEAGNRISLWVRRMTGCADAPLDGQLEVGRRWVGIKLLPSPGPHLP